MRQPRVFAADKRRTKRDKPGARRETRCRGTPSRLLFFFFLFIVGLRVQLGNQELNQCDNDNDKHDSAHALTHNDELLQEIFHRVQ